MIVSTNSQDNIGENSMRIRAAIAVGLLGLAAACSTSTQADPTPSGATTTTTSASAPALPRCTDFPVDSLIGASATRMAAIETTGWTLSYGDADGKATTFQLGDATIDQVYKNAAKCTATVMVKIAPPAPPTPTPPPGPLTTVSDGTYLVGTDMEAGSYKTAGGKGCYWARLKDDSGSNIIANNLSDGPARFTAKKGEYVQISRCTFTKV